MKEFTQCVMSIQRIQTLSFCKDKPGPYLLYTACCFSMLRTKKNHAFQTELAFFLSASDGVKP